eukprot:CAMPEP_0202830722 /NCGR_PEP_ID=MMETSP1389-20130828/16358_1 /ASSEMBLY_ACC=CAM_ASM_000865 /TAXON_ID=302021 /ORGANISM="Rhodomonas sp., Strain CCMP768" /LENGTH=159 /DNA_ID=CAMNT_0049504387 /DNA_START=223 /DNA_END=702 /DNA_ORIENTATION=+
MTESDFLRDIDGKTNYGRKMGLHFTHIPAEMKREYFLQELQGSQTLPFPTNLDSSPASPASDRRFFRRDGSGTSAPSDIAALRTVDQRLQTHNAFDRRAPSSPMTFRPNTALTKAGGHSKVAPSPRYYALRYQGMGASRQFATKSHSSSGSGSSTPGHR